jgi:RNA polymerase sigma-70 factor (ECF subfamily)
MCELSVNVTIPLSTYQAAPGSSTRQSRSSSQVMSQEAREAEVDFPAWGDADFITGRVEVFSVDGYCKAGLISNVGDAPKVVDPSRNSGAFPVSRKETQPQQRVLELYDAYSSRVYKYIRGLGVSREQAEDTIQEVFLRLAVHLLDGGEERNMRSWIFQVAHNLSMDIHRESSRGQIDQDARDERVLRLIAPCSSPEEIYLRKEAIKRVNVAMTTLTPKQRSGVLLRAEGLRYMEIASVLGVSESRAIYLVKRALMRLAGGL